MIFLFFVQTFSKKKKDIETADDSENEDPFFLSVISDVEDDLADDENSNEKRKSPSDDKDTSSGKQKRQKGE